MSISVAGDGLLLSQKGDLVVADGTAEGRLAVGTDGQILTASSTDSLGVKWIDAPSATQKWATIAYSQVTANTTTLVFSSIASTYTDLKLIVSARGTATSGSFPSIRISANSITSGYSIYYDAVIDTSYSNYSSIGGETRIAFEGAPPSLGNSENSLGVLDIMDYRSTTKAKSVLFRNGFARNSSSAGQRGAITVGAASINTLDAITSLTIHCGLVASPNLAAGSWALLMGVIR
jgi:hypothetical protein